MESNRAEPLRELRQYICRRVLRRKPLSGSKMRIASLTILMFLILWMTVGAVVRAYDGKLVLAALYLLSAVIVTTMTVKLARSGSRVRVGSGRTSTAIPAPEPVGEEIGANP
jgi:hypothetical protein